MKMSCATRSFVSEEYWYSSAISVLFTLGPKLITAFGIGHMDDVILDQTIASFLFVCSFVFPAITFIVKYVIYCLLLHRHGKKKIQYINAAVGTDGDRSCNLNFSEVKITWFSITCEQNT